MPTITKKPQTNIGNYKYEIIMLFWQYIIIEPISVVDFIIVNVVSSSVTVKGVAISFVDFIFDNVVSFTSTVSLVAINVLCNKNV